MFFLQIMVLCLLLSCFAEVPAGEFLEQFNGSDMLQDPTARDGWAYLTGDGEAELTFSQAGGIGLIEVDARGDQHNIWWAFIRRSVSAHIDGETLARPDRELRVEAKIRTDTAPRRVNLHFNHSRTTDYHSHLMEYDIPDTQNWHVISLTTKGFDALPEDEVFVQMALMDWGRDCYNVEIDYLKVSVVDPANAGPDLGAPLAYRPPIPSLETYSHVVTPAEDGIVDLNFPGVNFRDWTNKSEGSGRPLLAVGGSLVTLTRWELKGLKDRSPMGWGVLEVTTEQVYRAETGLEEFGELRVVEILDGDPSWSRKTVTLDGFLAGKAVDEVFNGQMIVDVPPALERGGKTLIAISPPVLQRLLTGRTRGLAIYGLGAVNASFYSGVSSNGGDGPKLYLNIE